MNTKKGILVLPIAFGVALAWLCLMALPAQKVRAATYTVNTNLDEEDGSCSDGDCSLRDAIQIAASGDTIDFDTSLAGQTITLTIDQLTVDKDLTIDGSALSTPLRISGNNARRVFYISGDVDVILSHLDIISGTADSASGGGIYNEGTLTITNCSIAGNSASYNNGGGIYNSGVLLVYTSTLTGNTGDYGGAIRNDNILDVFNSTFIDNSAQWGGAVDNYVGEMVITNSAFYSNTATNNGGAITSGAPLTVTNSTFTGNSALSGGAIENHEFASLTIEDSEFYSNTATNSGGGIINYDGTLEISNSRFQGNSAQDGGGVSNQAILLITNTDFSGNTVTLEGGGIANYTSGVTTVVSSTISGNSASSDAAGYGGGIENYGALSVENSRFVANTAHYNGGAIESWDGSLILTNTTFISNNANVGGAIVNNWFNTMTVTLSTFQENWANSGGGIYNDNNSVLSVVESNFYTNTAADLGGGIYNSATLTVTNSTFDSNASAGGGGLYNNSRLWVYNSTLASNVADGDGGGLINDASGTLTLSNSTLNNNSAVAIGGGVRNLGELEYLNTIIANSPNGGDCFNTGTISANFNNLVEDGSCNADFSGDPSLGDLADNGGTTQTCALLSDSPAIDMGYSDACLATDQRSQARDDWNCDIGAFELQFADSPSVIKTIDGAGVYTFGPTKVKVEISSAGSLNQMAVTKTVGDHPGRTGSAGGNGVGWGEYFSLSPNAGANGTFTATLTLPTLYTPDADDKVCRHISGTTWDCAAHSYSTIPFNIVAREDVTAFSDWAAGNNVGPTALQLISFRATSAGSISIVLALAALIVGLTAWLGMLHLSASRPRKA